MTQPIRARRGTSPPPPRRSRDVRRTFVSADLEVLGAVYAQSKDVAELLGVDPAQLSRWGRTQLPDAENQRRVRTAADVVRELCTTFEPEVVPGWLNAPRLGEGRSAADLLREGRYSELWDEVQASLSGEMS